MATVDLSKLKKAQTYDDGAGSDTIIGSNFNDIINGGAGNDTITGGNGDDTIHGGADNDTLWGDSLNNANGGDNGQDRLFGDAGNDIVHGGNGKDYVDGGIGNDSLYGDNGSDVLFGDTGADHLYGGNAGDNFNYVKTIDSTAGGGGVWSSTTGDWIHDFKSGEGDKLDFTNFPASELTGAGGNDLTWNGSAPGAHKIWSDGHFVYADTNGDNTADLVIKVEGVGVNDILGINHAPTDGDETAAAKEDVTLTADGNLLDNAADPDSDDLDVTVTGAVADVTEVGFDVRIDGTYGSLFVNSETGAYHYVLDNDAVQHLPEGESHDDAFAYEVTDGHGGTNASTLTVTVTGTNDAAVITDAALADFGVKEDTDAAAGGTLLVSDVDDGESVFDPLSGTAGTLGDNGHGTFTFDATTGAWTYTLDDTDPAVQALGEGDPLTDTHTVKSIDGTEHVITVNITGTNDPAIITDQAGADLSVTEDTDLSAGGTLLVSDVDTGEDAFDSAFTTAAADGTNSHGTFTFDAATGAWTYALDNSDAAVQALNAGDLPLTDSYEVKSVDGTSHIITVNINGTDDGPPAAPPINTGGGDPNDFDDLLGVTTVGFNDVINGDGSDNHLNGANGGPPGTELDDIINGLGGDDNLDGNSGNDLLYGGAGNDTLTGNTGDDTLYGQAGVDGVSGNNGDDTLYGGSGNDTITGGNDADTIFGGSGNDTINASNGDDRITGGFGADTITGGGDADTFVFRDTADTGDTILDFNQAEGDMIEFNGSLGGDLGGLTFADLQIDQDGTFTYISIDNDPAPGVEFQVKLTGTITLTNSDFIFNA